MRIRPASLSDEEYGDHDQVPPPAGVLPDVVEWRVPRRLAALKFAAAAGIAALSLIAPTASRVAVALTAAAVMLGYAIRDLVAPVRLRLDRDGLVAVRGYARRRAFPWSVIEAVRPDSRLRFGIRVDAIEVDAGDDILIFGSADLGVPVREAVATVTAFRDRATDPTGPTGPTGSR